MKINEIIINETMTAGSVATVVAPLEVIFNVLYNVLKSLKKQALKRSPALRPTKVTPNIL
jgi:uncharacterized membrane protein